MCLHRSFNPQPPRRTAATAGSLHFRRALVVSILSRPEGRLLREFAWNKIGQSAFQSSAAPKDGCYTQASLASSLLKSTVSILSRPEGRLLRSRRQTGSLSPMCFNPQPPRRTAATCSAKYVTLSDSPRFQSSAAPKDGCYGHTWSDESKQFIVSILSRPEGRLLLGMPIQATTATMFQSSAAPKDGCYYRRAVGDVRGLDVSILSRPEGRLLPSCCSFISIHSSGFQSSAAPKDGCYCICWVCPTAHQSFNPQPPRRTAATRTGGFARDRAHTRFNPQPPRRTAATMSRRASVASSASFNPQPPRRTAATITVAGAAASIERVSILSRPEGRLLLLYLNFVSVLRERPLSRLFQALFPPPGAFIQV